MAKQPFHLADFEILRRLGAGGMAEVFLAKKRGAEGTFKLLVVKRILPAHGASRRFRSMFVEEAHLATRLNHPNIVQVYEFSDHGEDGLLLSMEYVEGFDLGKLMGAAKQKGARIPPYVAAFIIAEAGKGLHYAHERKDEGGMPLAIVHRDVSPQNILLSCEGIVKIADFGIASASLFREEPGVLKGKFNYMSPEQARGEKADRRSDIYALGVTFYEMLTLRSPYGKLDDEKLLEAVRTGAFEPPSNHVHDVPPELEAIVLRAMSRVASDRYQTARDMAGAIARVLITKQELIDNTSVEGAILHLLGRAPMTQNSLPPSAGPPQAQTLAAVRLPRGGSSPSDSSGGVSSMRSSSRGAYSGSDPASPSSRSNPRIVREVRHVAVVTLRIQGIDELETVQGRNAARRTCDSIRSTLDDIAYKRGAVWSWGSNSSACALVGLLANPSRAAAEAASLAIDTHEALAGASEDLPIALRAALGIVRGVASGERDEQGNLVNHELQGGVMNLAGQLGARTPFGKTWVGGGVYRLVRRDFRWSDAPSLDIEGAAGLNVPPQMRLYALHRPLTREERIAEIAVSANDLVGRDAEKADLQAAFHRAVTAPPGGAAALAVGTPGARPSRASSLPPDDDGSPIVRPGPTSPPPDGEKPRGEVVTRAIVGEMGIGKTALIGAFLGELPGEVRVLRVECTPVKSELPFATVSDLLRDITAMGLDHSIEEASTVLRALLGSAVRSATAPRVVARLAELVTGKTLKTSDDDAQSYRRDLIVQGMRGLLAGLAKGQATVIVIDGLQWADRMSLELLQELLTRVDLLPVLVLLITRPDDRVLPFLERFVRIEIKGLTAEEQVRLVEARLGVRAGVAAICSELVARVAGNPFFLLEMIDALLERGTLEIAETPGGQHELIRHERPGDKADALPSTLEQLISDRIRELPPAEHDIVDWLAVAGGPLESDDLRALARVKGESDEAVMRLCARGLCDRKGGLCDFRHPLARDVAYLALDPQNRARMHRILGEYLAQTPLGRGLSAAIVARHLVRGDAPEKAADYYLEAARAARNAHQLQLAQRYFQRVLARLPPGDKRLIDVHEALEATFRLLGRRRERRSHLVALRQLAKQSRNARYAALALVRTARLELDEGYLARGLPIAQRAAEIAHLAKHPSLEVEAQTILSEILRELGDVQGAISACERALRVAQAGNLAAKARAEVLRSKGALLRRVGRVHESVEAQVEAIAVFKAVGARRSEARAKSALAFAMFALERFEDAIALGHDSLAIDLAIGGRFQIAKTLSNIGQAFARLGDTDRGLAYMQRAREAHERYGDQDSRADTLLGSAWILLEAGDVDAASTFCGDAGALVAVTGSGYDTVHERIIRALIARARGDMEGAGRLAAEARQLAESQGLISYHVYATAIEAAARVDSGEHHTGVLLARTALGAIEATQGSEYGVEVRVLSSEALHSGSPASARDAILRAASHAREVGGSVRDEHLQARFFQRDIVHRILIEAARYGAAEAQGDEHKDAR